ncbi:hypothetical protein Zmor_003909 [Zophobas morio]|uniref:Uncharacterized protein n=1 Tax=Zophobas morio TaxID=2755281 RepID=A0AA38HLE7_9CUCU|nr:hypothetical protein Zmor_003909 [Zophobas morio]
MGFGEVKIQNGGFELPTIPEILPQQNHLHNGWKWFHWKSPRRKAPSIVSRPEDDLFTLEKKRGQAPEKRIKTITDLPLFDVLKSKNPDSLNKN